MPRVAVLGGGMGGLAAAHELLERGFDVDIYEMKPFAGGKARSIWVQPPATRSLAGPLAPVRSTDRNADGLDWYAGEHGFRFFPGFYKHVVDSMRRTTSVDGRPVAAHLVPTSRVGITQYDKPDFDLPAQFPRDVGDATALVRAIVTAFGPVTGLEPEDLAFFASRIWQILTSCHERRLAEYEQIDWWDFIDADARSGAYRKFLASGITRSLVAAKARRASTRTIGDIFVQLVLTMLNPTAETTDRVLDGPTSRIWIHPWRRQIETMGGVFHFETTVVALDCDGGRISSAWVQHGKDRAPISADYFVSAVPVERFAPLVTSKMTEADPRLASLHELAQNVEWMNGIQYYLRRDVPMVHGHVIHIDTPWALTTISQAQFWREDGPARFGNGAAQGILSVDISDWDAPGHNGRPAERCTREEVARETWEQLKRSVNGCGDEVLRDDDLIGWFLDPDIQSDPASPERLRNTEPLLVNLTDTWRLRPDAVTGIENLFLASDYVRTYTDLATMEAANEAARRAVNGILEHSGIGATRCEVWNLHEPEIFAPWRAYDSARFGAGLSWDNSLTDMLAGALRGGAPIVEEVHRILADVTPSANRLLDAVQPAADALPTDTDARLMLDSPATDAVFGPGGFVERLGWYREQTVDAMLGVIPTNGPREHLYDLVTDFLARPGKGLRGALCLATACAYGATIERALPSAAGLELLHNAFLVHDDIEDGSEERRGAPTMHTRTGVPIATNVGDAMNALAMRLFRRNFHQMDPGAAARIIEEVDHMVVETLEGQAMELGWVKNNDTSVGLDDYLRLVLKKTAWYSFIHPMRIGALVAKPEDDDLDRFNPFGFLLGAAFQIRDDVLNLEGAGTAYGKESRGDLWEGKRTLILAHALADASPEEFEWIRGFLGRPRHRRLPREVARLHEILRRGDSIARTRRSAEALAGAARDAFEQTFAGSRPGPDLDFLHNCVGFLVERDA